VLTWVQERDRALHRMVHALKPGGWLVIEDFDGLRSGIRSSGGRRPSVPCHAGIHSCAQRYSNWEAALTPVPMCYRYATPLPIATGTVPTLSGRALSLRFKHEDGPAIGRVAGFAMGLTM
jgi:hypothetical protein